MKPRALTTLFLAAALGALAPLSRAQAELPGIANSATVQAKPFTQEQLHAELARQFTERFQLRGELQLELIRPWTPLLAVGPVEVVVVGCPSRLAPSLLVQVRLRADGRTLGVYSLNFKAQLFRDVWVVRAPIERGSNFDPSQLGTMRVDVLQEHDAVPTDSTDGEYSYATSLTPGRQLAWRDLTRRTLVRKGQIVEVSAVDGLLSISTKAMAMENGASGDTVKLRNLESKKDFTALVVAEARAQVRF